MRNRFSLALPLITLAVLSTLVPSMAAHQPSVEWKFDMHEDKQANPHTTVYLLVNGHRHKIVSDIEEKFADVDPTDYSNDGIPRSALTACQGWWAGSGDVYYVVRYGRTLSVYHRENGEGPDNKYGPKNRVASIRL